VLRCPVGRRPHPRKPVRRARPAVLAGPRNRHRQVVRPQALLPPPSRNPRVREQGRPGPQGRESHPGPRSRRSRYCSPLSLRRRATGERRSPLQPAAGSRRIGILGRPAAASSAARVVAVAATAKPPWAPKVVTAQPVAAAALAAPAALAEFSQTNAWVRTDWRTADWASSVHRT